MYEYEYIKAWYAENFAYVMFTAFVVATILHTLVSRMKRRKKNETDGEDNKPDK